MSLNCRQWIILSLYPIMIIMCGVLFWLLVAWEFRYFGQHRAVEKGGRHRAR